MKCRSSDLRGERAGLGLTVRRRIDLKDFTQALIRSVWTKRYKTKQIPEGSKKTRRSFLEIPRLFSRLFGKRIPDHLNKLPVHYEREIQIPCTLQRLIIEVFVLPILLPVGNFLFLKKSMSPVLISAFTLSAIGLGRIIFPEIFVDEVVDVIGPSKLLGINDGDILVSINGNSSKGSLKALRVLLDEGKVGESVRITVRRKLKVENTTSSTLLTYDVVRDFVSLVQVKHALLPHGIGYLSIKEFSERTFVDTVEALKRLHFEAKEKNGKLGGIVIDLRGNLGGTLSSALDIAAIFLTRGKILMKVRDISRKYL
jgi:hypothetical protein